MAFLLYCPFFSPSRAQVEPSRWFLRWMAQMTCFRQMMVLLGVRTMDDVTWGKYFPKTPQKGAWRGSFKPKRQNLYIAISPGLLIRRSCDLMTEFKPRQPLRGWSAITPKQIQHGWRPPSENRCDVIFPQRMFRLGQNSTAGCRMTRRLRRSRIPIWRTFVFQKRK